MVQGRSGVMTCTYPFFTFLFPATMNTLEHQLHVLSLDQVLLSGHLASSHGIFYPFIMIPERGFRSIVAYAVRLPARSDT